MRMTLSRAALIGILLATVIGACATRTTSDKSLAFVDPEEAAALLQGRAKLLGLGGTTSGVCIDPRSEDDYRAGHIPGALHLPLERLRDRHKELSDYDVIVVYGDTYNSTLAIAMSKAVIEFGYKQVHTLRGGLVAWQDAGFDLAK